MLTIDDLDRAFHNYCTITGQDPIERIPDIRFMSYLEIGYPTLFRFAVSNQDVELIMARISSTTERRIRGLISPNHKTIYQATIIRYWFRQKWGFYKYGAFMAGIVTGNFIIDLVKKIWPL